MADMKRQRNSDDMGMPSPIYDYTEDACPGHVASLLDPKVCARCGVHIDSLRPPDDL